MTQPTQAPVGFMEGLKYGELTDKEIEQLNDVNKMFNFICDIVFITEPDGTRKRKPLRRDITTFPIQFTKEQLYQVVMLLAYIHCISVVTFSLMLTERYLNSQRPPESRTSYVDI